MGRREERGKEGKEGSRGEEGQGQGAGRGWDPLRTCGTLQTVINQPFRVTTY